MFDWDVLSLLAILFEVFYVVMNWLGVSSKTKIKKNWPAGAESADMCQVFVMYPNFNDCST